MLFLTPPARYQVLHRRSIVRPGAPGGFVGWILFYELIEMKLGGKPNSARSDTSTIPSRHRRATGRDGKVAGYLAQRCPGTGCRGRWPRRRVAGGIDLAPAGNAPITKSSGPRLFRQRPDYPYYHSSKAGFRRTKLVLTGHLLPLQHGVVARPSPRHGLANALPFEVAKRWLSAVGRWIHLQTRHWRHQTWRQRSQMIGSPTRRAGKNTPAVRREITWNLTRRRR